MRDIRVIQIGNIIDDTNIGFKNPQRGRVYSIEGIAPTVCNYSGGGGLQPKIIVYGERKDNNAIPTRVLQGRNMEQ